MNFRIGLCIVILLVAATSAERGDLRIFGGSRAGIGFLLLDEGNKFVTACFDDDGFDTIQGSIACRQLGFTHYQRSGEAISDESSDKRVAVLRNSSCTEGDTRLIDCMDVKFRNITELPDFVCTSRQLTCSNSAATTPYQLEATKQGHRPTTVLSSKDNATKQGHRPTTVLSSKDKDDKVSPVDTGMKAGLGRDHGCSLTYSGRVMAVFAIVAVVWNFLYC